MRKQLNLQVASELSACNQELRTVSKEMEETINVKYRKWKERVAIDNTITSLKNRLDNIKREKLSLNYKNLLGTLNFRLKEVMKSKKKLKDKLGDFPMIYEEKRKERENFEIQKKEQERIFIQKSVSNIKDLNLRLKKEIELKEKFNKERTIREKHHNTLFGDSVELLLKLETLDLEEQEINAEISKLDSKKLKFKRKIEELQSEEIEILNLIKELNNNRLLLMNAHEALVKIESEFGIKIDILKKRRKLLETKLIEKNTRNQNYSSDNSIKDGKVCNSCGSPISNTFGFEMCKCSN